MQNYKKVIGSISIVTVSYLMSRVLGFYREIMLAKWTGLSEATDILDLAFVIPDFLFYLSAGGYLAITLIPLLNKQQEDKVNKYYLSLLYGLTIIFIILTLSTYFLRYQIANFLNVKNIEFFIEIFTPVVFSQLFFFIGAILMAFQYFKENFLYPSLAPVIYNCSIIFFGWINSTSPEETVKGFAIGTLVGSILGHLIIQLIGVIKSGLIIQYFLPNVKYLKEYLFISLPLIVGQSIAVIDEQLFRYFGSLLDTGSIASFRYARRIALLPVGIIAQAIGVASYPFLSKLFKNNKYDELKILVRKQLVYLLVLNGALMVFGLVNSESIIKIVYQRGNFTAIETNTVSSIFFIICFAILPWSINQILTRTFYVQEEFWFPVVSGTLVTLLTILYMSQIKNPSTLKFALTIVFSLYVYTFILLLKLGIDREKLLNKELFNDFIKSLLIFSTSYFTVEKIDFSNEITSMSLSILAIAIIVFVLVKLLKFKYINLSSRE
ncbi:MAG: hypothetical protein O3A48_00940 [Actinomycetota bacterium]|nr:hypothetical protein [Actinomycetota bacterium]MDA3013095.1 hypothetical protein [Actinomycetota bacterium]